MKVLNLEASNLQHYLKHNVLLAVFVKSAAYNAVFIDERHIKLKPLSFSTRFIA